jgi:hypothetical protein
MKNADWARPILYSWPQIRPHSDTVDIPGPPTHSQALGSMSHIDADGVHQDSLEDPAAPPCPGSEFISKITRDPTVCFTDGWEAQFSTKKNHCGYI